jgi:hypothetical protein
MDGAEVVPINRPSQPAPRPVIYRPITVTRFPDRYAKSKRHVLKRFRDLPDAMGKRTARSKNELPLAEAGAIRR